MNDQQAVGMESDDVSHRHLVEELNRNCGFRIGHINVNGLQRKLNEISILLNDGKFDVLAVSETHLSNEIEDSEISIPCYTIVRNDRLNKRNSWGGTLVYYSETLNTHQSETYDTNTIEGKWLEIVTKSSKVLLGCIYRPPNDKKFLNNFTLLLNNICTKRTNLILAGDFNFDMSKNGSTINDFKNLLYTHNLINRIKVPVRITETFSTTIDLIITTKTYNKNIISTGAYDPSVSDHHLVYAIVNTYKPRRKPKYITVTKCVNETTMMRDFSNVPW